MQQQQPFFKHLFSILVVYSTFCIPLYAQTDVLWEETWEDSLQASADWGTSAGLWEWGTPSNGPSGCHEGARCAGTLIHRNYVEPASTVLLREFTVPPADQNPRLRFTHWFSFKSLDKGVVLLRTIKVENRKRILGPWKAISDTWENESSSGTWTSPLPISLSPYADSLVQVGFYFKSANDRNAASDFSSGWYIDQVGVYHDKPDGEPTDSTSYFMTNIWEEAWEDSLQASFDWGATAGLWEWGTPTVGPSKCHEGTNCAATLLHRNYVEPASTVLTREFTVPSLSLNPHLRFTHWYSFKSLDSGRVLLRTIRNDGGGRVESPWNTISDTIWENSSSGNWSTPLPIDLSAYADSLVQVGFYFKSANDRNAASDFSTGWYIDQVAVVNRARLPLTVTDTERERPAASFNLDQNFPNPFRASTTIMYSTNSSARVKIVVYDVLGREVDRLVDEYKPEGQHETIWKPDGLAGGLYVYRIEVGEYSESKKLFYLR